MSLFPDRIETDRLRLKALTAESADVLALYEHLGEGADHIEETTEYVTWDPHRTPKETQEFVDHAVENREDGEGATYLVYPREGEDGAGEFAGTTAIGVDWERRVAELGIWLRKPFWSRGYSSERAGALIEVAFERLDLDLVAVGVMPGNENSKRAVEQYVEAHGGRHEGLLRNERTTQDGEPVDIHRYTISQSEYREATRSR